MNGDYKECCSNILEQNKIEEKNWEPQPQSYRVQNVEDSIEEEEEEKKPS